MRLTLPIFWLGLVSSAPAICEDAVAEMPQLQQLNRASQQQLRDIQDASEQPGALKPLVKDPQLEQLNRKQNTEQQVLQEGQRREVLMQGQRAKVAPSPGRPYRLQAIDRQSQFRLQQQYQLNRFRTQQRGRNR